MGTVKEFPDWSVAFFVWTGDLGSVGGGQRGRPEWSEEGGRGGCMEETEE